MSLMKLALSPIMLAVLLLIIGLLMAVAIVFTVLAGIALAFVLTIGWVLGKEVNDVRSFW